MRYNPIDPTLFIRNRQRFTARLKPKSLAVFHAGDVLPKSADGVRRFIQQTDLFYLSGIDQEETILVLSPDAPEIKHREILFIRKTDEKIALWEGRKLTQKAASELSGIQTVLWTDAFPGLFRALALDSRRIYLNTNEHPRADVTSETRDARFITGCRAAYPLHRYERAAPILHDLRAIKSDVETALIREAIAITEKAFRRVLGFVRPGVHEYEIEAEIVHEFVRNRSRWPAYEPIIASGPHTCVLHYVANDRQCQDGDLLLLDFGAEYANYAADLSRTLPVSGRFTDRQRAVYDAVLRVQRQAIGMLRPGNTLKAYHLAVGEVMAGELIGLGLLDADAVASQKPEEPLYKKYFMHGTSHHLGLDVHDYGHTHRPFEPGMVFTCEPGIYIPEESIGIRIENDILITHDAPVDLTAAIPIEAPDIEALMAR